MLRGEVADFGFTEIRERTITLGAMVEPQPGEGWNPWAEDCRILDVCFEVRTRWAAGKKEEAKKLLEGALVRLMLDSEFAVRENRLVFGNQEERVVITMSNLELAVFLSGELGFPGKLAQKVVWGLVLIPGREGGDVFLPAANYFWSAGDPIRALRLLRLSLLHHGNCEIDYDWSRVAFLHYLRAEVALESGEGVHLHENVASLVKHAPRHFQRVEKLVGRLPEWRREIAGKMVEGWFAGKIERHPGRQWLSEASARWTEMFFPGEKPAPKGR
jgi:hypothetical protein